MTTRRSIREQLFMLLFSMEFQNLDEMDEQTKLFYKSIFDEAMEEATLEDNKDKEQIAEDMDSFSEELDKAEEEVRGKLDEILTLLPEIDNRISENMTGWTISRIGKVELAIMRLSVYEMLYDDEVPNSVSINEAVELAKKYGLDDAGAFVNGILGKVEKSLND